MDYVVFIDACVWAGVLVCVHASSLRVREINGYDGICACDLQLGAALAKNKANTYKSRARLRLGMT